MKCKDWPFRPQHITDVTADLNGDNASRLGELAKLEGPGILSHSHLQGFQSAISSAIGLPTTIIEFAPNGDPVRTDSPFLGRSMNLACRRLREGCDCCGPADIAHAKLFHDNYGYKSLSKLRANVEEAKRKVQSSGHPYGSKLHAEMHASGRVYLTYDCPNIGYREHVFPIIFGERLLGVFFSGQIILDVRQDEILQRIRSLPERIPSSLLRPGYTADALAKDIELEHVDWIGQPDHITNSDRLVGLVSTACDELSRLEKQLGDNLDLQKKIYVTSKIREIMSAFRTGLPKDVLDSRETLDDLWQCAGAAFKSIVEAFALRYIVLFGVKQAAVNRVQTLHVVAKAGDCPSQFAVVEPKPTLNLKVVEDILNAKSIDMEGTFVYASEVENTNCLAALKDCDRQQCGDFELVLLPVPLHPQSSIGLLFGYRDDHKKSMSENSREGDLHNAFEAFGSLLASSVSAALGGIAQKITYDQLKILGHESSQLIAGIDLMRDTYLQNYATIRMLAPEKANDVCRNLETFLQNLDYLFTSVKSLLLETLPYRPEEFLVGRDLLFKWKEFNRYETRRKDLQISIPEIPKYSSAAYSPVWGDKALFEQLLYNLLNNAVKYSHRGTAIHLDCSLASGAWNAPHRLTVTDYGVEMPNHKRVYELYYRMNRTVEGLGVGLFLCKRIAEAHGGRIGHTSKLISRFNVSLIDPFLEACGEGQCAWSNEQLVDDVRKEHRRVADRIKDVVATGFKSGEPLFKPRPHEITQEDLYQPTYEVTAWVELPRRSREIKR